MSAYTLQLIDAKNDVAIKQISGTCSSSDEFLALLNEAIKSLAIRGGWFDLEQRINFCISSCYVVWPHFVGTVLGMRFCGSQDGLMRNQWYSFTPNTMNFAPMGIGSFGLQAGNPFPLNGWRSDCVIEDAGMKPCYKEITGTTGKLIRYNIVKANDVGKKITIYGKKYGGQPLQEQDSTGAWVDGITLTAATPFVSTSVMVTEITAITREETEGMAYLYEYDPSANALRDLAVFQPYETNPRYRASRIINIPSRKKDDNGVCWTSVEALVKLKFIPVKHDRDFLMISNLRAVKLAMQAILQEQAGNDSQAIIKWELAVKELNLENRDLQPDRTTSVFVNSNYGRSIRNPI